MATKITVAVPTIAGRSAYLGAALRTCVAEQDDDIEILVSDNSDGDAREIVSSLSDTRVRYVKPHRYLPLSMHWDFVLNQLTGEIFTIIGDDDGLMPGAIGRVREIARDAPDMPIHHALCNYRWPDFPDPQTRNAVEFFHAAGGHGSRIVDSRQYLAGVAGATLRYVDGPMVYHNFIPTRLVRSLINDGVFFRRSSPDVYSAVAIAANTPRFFSTDQVLTISGQGAKANGAAVQAGSGDKFIAEMNALYAPRYGIRAAQMHLLDALVEVAEHFDRPDLLENVSYTGHFMAAVIEARRMGEHAVVPEIRATFASARRHGVSMRLATALVARAVRRRLRPSIGPARSVDQVFQNGDVIRLPPSVRDIFDAAHAVSDLLGSPLPQATGHVFPSAPTTNALERN